jgi:uncharacterized protein HemX
VSRPRVTNGMAALGVLLALALFIGVGARHVWTVQKEMVLRHLVFREVQANREQRLQRDAMERRQAELRASTRVRLHANGMGMRPPQPEERIRVGEVGPKGAGQ